MDIAGIVLRLIGFAWSVFALAYLIARTWQAARTVRRWTSGPEPASVQVARDLWGWDIAPGAIDRARGDEL